MSTFQAVNTTTLTAPDPPQGRPGEETTPTTPRPNANFFPHSRPSEDPRAEDPSAKTPTRNTFGGLAGQRPLPNSPFTPQRDISETPSHNSHDSQKGVLTRENSHRSTQSVGSHDVEMGEEDDGSDNDSVTSDTNRPSKKKKGQRFFCTEFPPCQLSFTRSEHLARHIRKHTGERPFQCHCSRRFSRLDNLRQHAQTVHVNEDIPGDSLAATGTRFQRQIRTERVRPPGRSRANTLGSQGGHSRGHSRNLSASSITSTASTMSIGPPQDVRRRPPPLAMANDPAARARISLNTLDAYNPPLMGSPGPQIVDYTAQSAGATTPTSATFSTATGSPGRYGSALQSPVSSSRPVSWAGSRTPGRRLSVPSANNPFSGTPGQPPPPYITPLPSSTSSTFSGQSSVFGSPISSQFSEARRDSTADSDWRRRTWHPGGTYSGPRAPTSGLGFQQTPDAPRPTYTSQPAASQTTRLPGIESFDHAPPPPSLPLPRRQPSPMQIDIPTTRPATYHAPSDSPLTLGHEKRKSISWDTTLQRGINRLEIASPNPAREHWPPHYQSSPGQSSMPRPTTAPHPSYYNQSHQPRRVPQPIQIPPMEPANSSQEPPVTPRKNKRHGWYNGPIPLQQAPPQPHQQQIQPLRAAPRTSPEDSSSSEGIPTPSSSSMTEYHPAIVHSNGLVEAHPTSITFEEHKSGPPASIMDRPHPIHQQYRSYHNHSLSNSTYQPQREPERRPISFGQPLPPHGPNDMRRLEALVAVATGEQQVNRP